jgi:non-homologous end joining protein Ku
MDYLFGMWTGVILMGMVNFLVNMIRINCQYKVNLILLEQNERLQKEIKRRIINEQNLQRNI